MNVIYQLSTVEILNKVIGLMSHDLVKVLTR